MLIFKIFRADEWAALRKNGVSDGAPIDVTDGYVHFKGEEGLFLLALEAESLGDALKWEPSRGGALFPHLYRPLKIEDVVWAQPLPLVDGAHEFPAGLGAASA